MPPVQPEDFDQLSEADKRAALLRVFGPGPFGQVAAAIVLGESEGDVESR
jgi:hypothetical protein